MSDSQGVLPFVRWGDDPSQTAGLDGRTWLERIGAEASGDRGLELLVDMVRAHEVDPWDVDIRVVADRFLKAVEGLTPDDLPKSGRLLFFTSVIIRLKAQVLAGHGSDMLGAGFEDDGWIEGDEPIFQADGPEFTARRGAGEILLFPRDRLRKRRPLTIEDLLQALGSSEAHERKMEEKRRAAAGRNVIPFRSVREALDTLHKDDLEADVAAASTLVRAAFAAGRTLTIDDLGASLDRVSAFLALLFLAARGEVDLAQDEFYGPFRIVPPAAALPEAAEA